MEHHESNPIAQLDRISEKLSRLRDKDRAFSVFGSSSHEYRLGPPFSERVLAECEESLGVPLPAEYRLFVARIGHGGAGPYYGLFSLDEKDSEGITELDLIQKPFRWTEAFNPYDWDDPCSQEDVWCDEDAADGEYRQVILRIK